jgi:hypothetical protein
LYCNPDHPKSELAQAELPDMMDALSTAVPVGNMMKEAHFEIYRYEQP